MLGHETSHNKFKKTDIILSIFQPQEENWQVHKYIQIKHHEPEQSMNQRRNQDTNKKYIQTKEKET